MDSNTIQNLNIIIVAAGKGKRMNNPLLAKVMAELDGKPLIGHVLNEAIKLSPEKIIIVVGHQKDSVINYVDSLELKNTAFVEQKEQLGTGHAVNQAKPVMDGSDKNILILAGDVPLLSSDTLIKFIHFHNEKKSDVSVLSTIAPNPFGYGRIIRDDKGNFTKIVEEKDANEEEKKVNEINSGVFLLKSDLLFNSLQLISNKNSQGEYYLTDIIEILKNKGSSVQAFAGPEYDELQGVNSPEDLKKVEEFYYFRKNN
ncbi:MAG: NTP transferase domain-containing protein [Ignavibacteriae bacterium]|nr:NTP transferase domain-containing protein [Ignavibacteriota bacterium]